MRRGFLYSVGPVLPCALLVLSVAFSASIAKTKFVPTSRVETMLSFAPLVKSAAPAVVNIFTRRVARSRSATPFFNDPFFRRFFGDQFQFEGQARRRVENSLGSGVIVSDDGLIVTNYHVIEGADEITVVLADRREFEANVVTRDEQTDLAVLRIQAEATTLPFLKLKDSDSLEVGDLVLAIGNPFGVGQTVTSGIVSALSRTARGVNDFGYFIQTDAAINPGNSGGALISSDGKLVGINTAIYSRGGGSNGIGFAIPSNMVATVIGSARKGGQIVRPWIGARGQTVGADLARSLGLRTPSGVLVNFIYPNGPAARAGFELGDVIDTIDGRIVPDVNAMRFRIATLTVGEQAVIGIIRGGRPIELRLALIPAPEDPPRDLSVITGNNPLAGSQVANLSPALSEELAMDVEAAGVIIMRLRRGSPGDRIGLRAGDILVRLNGEVIDSVSTLKKLSIRSHSAWKIEIKRSGRSLRLVIRG